MAKPTISLMGATYSNVSGVRLPTNGGGTADFPYVEGSQTVTTNGTYDVTRLASMTVGVSSEWGEIGGNIADQTDLQNALASKADKSVTVSVTIAVADWSSQSCTKSVSGVTASNNIVVAPAPASFLTYCSSQIRATAQGSGTVTFACETVPSESVTVNVLILG